ncbi:alpha/beta fold hydrolase [Mycoplasma sp. 'Moose RK']|uniref:alpha/beta fold hydrolase n=1 Tax=Mycoplasma sp. 'Moose RK' TaxID=2780095 RepID=UPI0018C1D4AD|nr:alpha/beta hydrolase [Mycoplasma sp. 'Moose RK']MBG0730992.1 alpha/beta hydrolase [Mycoplasma sp. 'Moose RK']
MQLTAKIPIENEEIFYFIEENNRPKVLFLHGFNSNQNFIFQLKNKKDRKYDIVAVDFPGCGLSSQNEEITVEKYQDIIAKFIKILDIDISLTVGHSLGCVITLFLLKEGLTKKAILVAPLNPYIFQAVFKNLIKNLNIWLLPKTLEDAKNCLKNLVFSDKLNFRSDLQKNAINFLKLVNKKRVFLKKIVTSQILNPDWHRRILLPLFQQQNDFLIIGAANDNFVPITSLEKISEKFKKKLITINDCGHAVFFEKSEEINIEIEKMLEINL